MKHPLVVVGDALLDRDIEGTVQRVSPEAPVPVVEDVVERTRPGGAGLAAALAAADGREVTLVTALAHDAAGHHLRSLLEGRGVDVVDLGLAEPTPEKIRLRADGRSLLRVDRGDGPSTVGPMDAARSVIADAPMVLVSDYGRGVVERARPALSRAARRGLVVWDPHPRGPSPVPGARLVTPNAGEARRFVPDVEGADLGAETARARALVRRWDVAGVAITLADRGVVHVEGEELPLVVPARRVTAVDLCGAGDRFAATAAGLLADGALPSEAVTAAVAAATEFVAAGGAAAMPEPGEAPLERRSPDELAAAVRGGGGVVVATSGCFDLLHSGHVEMLEAARALGDCLIVCLNGDGSVRRLKGPGRPLVPAADRAAVLGSLACVDAVLLFDEDTPERALERIRPHVFAKGGDYAGADLPESRVLAAWGGQAVILPYVPGRSSTELMREVLRRGAA